MTKIVGGKCKLPFPEIGAVHVATFKHEYDGMTIEA
jgi:hypothetical protein